MSTYVRRTKGDRTSWVGPIRSPRQADREVAAWRDAGWEAEAVPSTPEVRAEVRAWVKAKASR